MSLKRDFISGIFYTSVAKYSGIIIQIFITAVLARLLTPKDFGVVAIVTVLIQFFNTLSEAGIGPAIIQKKELQKNEIESIFTFTLIIGLVGCITFFLCSPVIANYYHNDSLLGISRLLSILILFSSADIVTNGLLLKQKRFKIISIRTLSIQVITGGISVYTAYIGWGMYALVFSALSSKILIFFANYALNPLQLKFNFKCLRKIASYSSYQFATNLLTYFSRNTDKLIIGKYIGLGQLGYYEKSYRLMMLPLSNITYVFTPVMHPIFSELQNEPEKLFDKYVKLLKIISFLSFPITVFLYVNANELVLLFFGDQWYPSIAPFKILALTAALQVLHATTSGVFQASNNTKGLFIGSLISTLVMVGGFIISAILFKTIISIAYSYLITCTICSLLIFKILFIRFNKGLIYFLKIIQPAFMLAIIEFITVVFIDSFLTNIIPLLSFIIKSMIIIFITVTYLYINNKKELVFLFKSLRK